MEQKRYRIIHTARLILEQNGTVLFLAQTLKNGNGFTLPGGKINGTEFAKEALVREVKEEIGIELKKKQLVLRHVTYKKIGGSIEIIFFFYTDILPSTPAIREPEKFQEINWFLPKDYPQKMSAVLKETLARFNDGKIYTEFPKNKKKPELGNKILSVEQDTSVPLKKKKKPMPKKKFEKTNNSPAIETGLVVSDKKKKKPTEKKKTKIKITLGNLPDTPNPLQI